MGLVRILLPLSRAAARLAPGVGRPLHGAALAWCVLPRWVLLRPPPVARRTAWAEELVALHRQSGDPDRLARALVLQGHALLLSGRYEEACAAADGSLAVPGARPPAPQSAFAGHTRAQALLFGGRPEEALEAARETVESYRRAPAWASRARRRGRSDLAGALRTHALALGVLGRTAESVTVYEECVALLRSMSVRESARARLNHPRVYAELVRGLRVLGRYEEALALGPDARETLRGTIIWVAPEIVLALRVELLADLAACERAVGRPADGRGTAEEAVAEAHRLARRNPTVGEPQLAAALDGLVTVLDELGANEDELTALHELADVYTRLGDDPRLADTLDDLAHCLGRAGDHRAALKEGERALAVARRAADQGTGHREQQLAWILANLSLRQQAADAPQSAVASAREAVTLTWRLAEGDWSTYQPLTARRLRVLGQALRGTGEFTEAVACYEEAETALRELIDGGGDHTAELALTHSRLAATLHLAAHAHLDAGRTVEAVTALRSLLALTRRSDAPDVHARCVRTFAEIRAERGDDVTAAWQRATGEPYPTFRYTRVRGRGSNPAAR